MRTRLYKAPSDPEPGPLHLPSEAAKRLRCSEWWLKDQARKRRIPFAWVSGSYRFSDDHISEIVLLFEVRPATDHAGRSSPVRVPCKRTAHRGGQPVAQLKARTPPRARAAHQQPSLGA